MDKEEFQKKYNNSILVCCTENSIKKVFNICDLMDLTASKSKQITAILIGEQTAKSPLFHVEQFLNDFYNEVGATKKTILFKQKMKDAKKKIIHKYNNFYIRKGTDMETVVELIQALDMNVTTSPINNAILIGEGGKTYPVTYQARQFIADLMSNMIDVLDSFINKETMVEIKESCNAEYLINEEDFHVFLKALYYLYKCNEWIKKDDEKNKEQPKEPVFNKGNKIIYTIKDSNGNTYPVTRLSERVYESKEHKTLFITDEEGTVVGIYKEK